MPLENVKGNHTALAFPGRSDEAALSSTTSRSQTSFSSAAAPHDTSQRPRAQGDLRVYADLLPDEKLVVLQNLAQRFGPVAMVVDGVNDAPALAAGMGCGF